MIAGPHQVGGHWCWHGADEGAEVRFVGKGEAKAAAAVLGDLGEDRPVALLRQIHSARVIEAASGLCGEGDALWSQRPGLALAVITADCVPVLLAGAGAVAAVHAGWRGIAAGIVGRAVARLRSEAQEPAGEVRAWIGPAIGPCCYEVGEEVAAPVAAASAPAIVRRAPHRKPYLDLQAAVALQLEKEGARVLDRVDLCTRCHGETLWSYRREGRGSGRNLAFVWLRDQEAREGG